MQDQTLVAGVAGNERGQTVNSVPFLDQIVTLLGNIRENQQRAAHILADAGFFADPSASPPPSPNAPDTKRAQIIDMLRDMEGSAIALVQQVNKIA